MSQERSHDAVVVSANALVGAMKVESVSDFDAIIRQVTTDPEQIERLSLGLARALMELDKAQERSDPSVLIAADDQFASTLQSVVAECADPNKMQQLQSGGVEAQFDTSDLLGWFGSVLNKLFNSQRFTWRNAPEVPESLPNVARLAMVGDWGTGLYGAPECTKSIAKIDGLTVAMHLGDVYYSGTDKEIEKRFLKYWPKFSDETRSRFLNSNHEMYSGGRAYDRLLVRAHGQSASYFALQNDNWILAGLDSAYDDKDLYGKQVEWLATLANNAGGRKIVLFSHHQPFDTLESCSDKIASKLGALLRERKIFAWYWGHAHRCMVYDQHATWGLHARCIGHGGMPYTRNRKLPVVQFPDSSGFSTWQRVPSLGALPAAHLLDGPNEYIPGEEAKFGPNGYATLELSGASLVETLHDPDGTEIYRHQLA